MKNHKSMLFPGCDFRDLGRAIHAQNNPKGTPATASASIQDDRTKAQQDTHFAAVVAIDSGMSGWGKAAGGLSLCVWACAPGVNVAAVLAWVEGRSDMENAAEINLNDWTPPDGAAHVHIYTVNEGHPATVIQEGRQ